jgi:hypothetical protein
MSVRMWIVLIGVVTTTPRLLEAQTVAYTVEPYAALLTTLPIRNQSVDSVALPMRQRIVPYAQRSTTASDRAHGARKGALVGGVSGAAIGAVASLFVGLACPEQTCSESTERSYVVIKGGLIGGVVGAVVGAGIGALWHRGHAP